jgi:hypothetical protein
MEDNSASSKKKVDAVLDDGVEDDGSSASVDVVGVCDRKSATILSSPLMYRKVGPRCQRRTHWVLIFA